MSETNAPEGNHIPGESIPGDYPDNPIEEQARNQGWKPYDEWIEEGNDPNNWVNPEVYLVKGEFIQKLKNQSRKITELERTLNDLSDHHKKVAEIEYEKALQSLKQQKAQALEDEDYDKVVEIDEKLHETKQEYDQQASSNNQNSSTNPQFEEWISRPENQWYVQDNVLRRQADALADEYMSQNQNATFDDIVKHVETQLATELPERFNRSRGGQSGGNPGPVAESSVSGSQGRGRRKRFGAKDLNQEQKKVGERFVRQGVFDNIQEYVDQLVEIGEIGGR